jgi:hypothetical protein
MTEKERRKHPRFKAHLEVIFYDNKRTHGLIVDISKNGCMVTLKDGSTKPVGSLITFRVFFHGKAQLEEKTVVGISLNEVNRSRSSSSTLDNYPHAVKILATVARHTSHEGKPSMGIHIRDLNDNDIIKWNRFMDNIKMQKFARPTPEEATKPLFKMPAPAEQAKSEPLENLPTYTLSFKTLEAAARYLPRNSQDTFFVPSKEQPEGRIVHIVMMHPVNKTNLVFNCVVNRFGTSPGSDDKFGVYIKFHNLDTTLKHQINSFLGQTHYN